MLAITVLKKLLLPPAFQLVLLLAAWLCWRRWPLLGRAALAISVLSLWVLSLPVSMLVLYKPLEQAYYQPPILSPGDAGAVVVLGAGRYRGAPEYGGDTLSADALIRLRLGAHIARQHQLPLLASGGKVLPFDRVSEAELAGDVIANELAGDITFWPEGRSRNTWENAAFSAEYLKTHGITQVVLVTQAFHMRRAEIVFRRHGLEVIPAAAGFYKNEAQWDWWGDWLPQARALFANSRALHEYIGLLFYELKYRMAA